MKAKVFLSCGQSKSSDEPAIAEKISIAIRAMGFECYMAVAEQSLLGLRENIFTQLESCDYFVFVDFKREELGLGNGTPVYRGSLFSHQELAIASFLEVPALVFQESGVKQLDGMLGALQANATPFSDRSMLKDAIVGRISSKIAEGEWQKDSRNCLRLDIAGPPFTDALQAVGVMGRFYHIEVKNLHHKKAALDCHAYLDSVLDLETGTPTHPKTIEFKWAGTPLPGVRIAPKSIREFDAVTFLLCQPFFAQFRPITDSPDYVPCLKGSGKFQLRFSVMSQNFGTSSQNFELEYGQNPESVRLAKA